MRLRLAFSLVLLFNLLIVFARVVGLSQPSSELLRDLRFTECSPPCWISILPGQTTFTEATDHIRTTFAIPHLHVRSANDVAYHAIRLPLPDGNASQFDLLIQFQLESGMPEGVITEIEWSFGAPSNSGNVPPVLLGDVVNMFGTPTCIVTSITASQGWYVLWDVPEGVISVNALGGNLSWSKQIYSLTMRSYPANYGQSACDNAVPHYPWRGLLSREQYQRRSSQ